MHPLFKTPLRPENFSYLVSGRESCTSERCILLNQIKELYVLSFLLVSFIEAPEYFQFFTEKWKTRKEQMTYCVDRINHRRKSNFLAFEKRNATAYEQNVWRVISTNATVLADDVYSEENFTMSEIAHCCWVKDWEQVSCPNFLKNMKMRGLHFYEICFTMIVIWKFLANSAILRFITGLNPRLLPKKCTRWIHNSTAHYACDLRF